MYAAFDSRTVQNMPDSQEADTSQAVVKTYVPTYQKDEWAQHADRLDMSQSEFVRTMVQAGRRGFELTPEKPDDRGGTPGGDGLEDRVLALLDREEQLAWDELVAALTDDVEDRLEDTLASLQDENRVRYDGRRGGYTVTDR